ncbi:hypothetical protein IW261DRAFT_1422929 [Armillaria novae-zelandiae]|uniref:Uncharacterized protein n=1 Tax=Armillaria novae-zelandiae TaxID=153914 RepID=A0AA39T9T3_9AGAR|nr:hypothetical protein IW261DRAFT_1422929 [Armillaria novae-zelandiae]
MVFQVSLLAAVGWDGQAWMPAVFVVFVALVLDVMMKDVEGFQDGCINPPPTNTLVEDGGHHLSCITLPQIEHVELGGQELSQLDKLTANTKCCLCTWSGQCLWGWYWWLQYLTWWNLRLNFLMNVPMVLDQAALDSCNYDK